MIYVGNDGHISDVLLLVHHGPDLVYREVHLRNLKKKMKHENSTLVSEMFEVELASKTEGGPQTIFR